MNRPPGNSDRKRCRAAFSPRRYECNMFCRRPLSDAHRLRTGIAATVTAVVLGGWCYSPWREPPRQHADESVSAARPAAQPTVADCRAMAGWIGRQLGPGHHVVVRPPFVLAGDLSEAELLRWYRETIEPAALAMRRTYFATPPNKPVTVLLYAEQTTYRRESRRLWRSDVSRHGFHRPGLHLIVTHVEFGPAALRHELTHVLMEFDYPCAPDWLAEGLAALHEDLRHEPHDERLVGLPGRRRAALQSAIADDRLPTLETLVGRPRFPASQTPTQFAHARFFCLYLQQRAMLVPLYRQMARSARSAAESRTAAADDSGTSARETVRPADLGFHDWAALEGDFHQWLKEDVLTADG